MAKGVFTPTELVELQVTLASKWKEPQYSKFYTPEGETVKAVMENQTASFTELERPDKEREVAVKWADWCDDTAITETNADSCANDDCDMPDPKSKTYALNTFISDCLIVTEEDFQTSVLNQQEVVADGMAAKFKNLYELYNKKILAIMIANAGTNPLMTNPNTGTTYTEAGNGATQIPSNEFKMETFYPYLKQVMRMLRSKDDYIIDGQNFFQEAIFNAANNLNDNGKTASALFKLFPYYNDILGFIDAGITTDTLVVDKGAVALANRVKWPTKPREYNTTNAGSFTRYSAPFPGLPGVNVDIQYEETCVDGGVAYQWKMKLRAGIFVNPIRCDAGNTGITLFERLPAGVA